MKGIYWRPKNVSRNVLLLIALLAIGGAFSVEMLKVKVKQDYYSSKKRAATQMEQGMNRLRELRTSLGVPIDKENDPMGSGIIGQPISILTSNTGYLEAKQGTINPNFAAVAVHLLKKAGVEEGDVIAVGFSGSFPALNLAVLCAADALKLELIIISSAAASEWGANIRGFTWLEMEAFLNRIGFTRFSSKAASLGGHGDKGHGMPKEGKEILKKIIADRGIPFLWPQDQTQGIEQRMAIYEEVAGDRPIKAYINVGGGVVSVGTAIGKRLFRPGLNRRLPPGALDEELDSIMVRFAAQDVPVIHFTKIKQLCERYGLPYPVISEVQVGQGNIFYKMEYNLLLVGGLLVVLLVCLWLLVRLNLGHRFAARSARQGSELPEPMV
jgi:poly-gamma-glutamate system protein